jgi:5'-nucleotidase
MTAGINGARAMAVSLDVGVDQDVLPRWENAVAVVRDLLPMVAEFDEGSVVNVNVPNAADVGPLRWARLATYGRAQTKITRVRDDVIGIATVEVDGELEPGTDAALLADGHATITPLRSISEDDALMGAIPAPGR